MHNEQLHLALVDDDVSVRKALTRLLSTNEFNIHDYASAAEFLHSLQIQKPGCLLLDLHMPEVDGLELLYQLRAEGVHIPTIVITAHNERGLSTRCESAGACAILIKPIEAANLFAAIQLATGRSETRCTPSIVGCPQSRQFGT